MKRLRLLSFLIVTPFTDSLYAQSADLAESYAADVRIRTIGMAILGIWAISNILIGGIGRSRLSGEKAYFHEMSMIWNVVNVIIAGAGYYFTAKADLPADGMALLADQVFFQKTLLFNSGLDLAYIVGGFYLVERSKNTVNKPERLKGYGKSVILQGVFLFIFDVVLHTTHVREVSGF